MKEFLKNCFLSLAALAVVAVLSFLIAHGIIWIVTTGIGLYIIIGIVAFALAIRVGWTLAQVFGWIDEN